ncbi:MAG: hypothetical protein OEZ48_16105, partial [Candidatus Bathyarchaeota archaeon]|nr:hypothetical protein [Candidatus Bathyarchaeota archaeon]
DLVIPVHHAEVYETLYIHTSTILNVRPEQVANLPPFQWGFLFIMSIQITVQLLRDRPMVQRRKIGSVLDRSARILCIVVFTLGAFSWI